MSQALSASRPQLIEPFSELAPRTFGGWSCRSSAGAAGPWRMGSLARGEPISVFGPLRRQVELTIHQRPPPRGATRQEHPELTIVDLPLVPVYWRCTPTCLKGCQPWRSLRSPGHSHGERDESPVLQRHFGVCRGGCGLFGGDDHCVVDLAGWVALLDAVVKLIEGRFGRVEPRRRVGAYLHGLLAGLERKNGWTLAEHAGTVSPDGMQRLLRTADWDIDGVRDDLRGYVLDQLGDSGGAEPDTWTQPWDARAGHAS